ncbi:hypothetical protein OHA72_43575 [Dactylosporangium sp. NBC_01737]|uniref:hypothetical protein n=1 Tax=Dactylosporangium sp. NBC_01737 TaxID=2975959 RepID=UPI002E11A490|nr:hypothetical protein OHA72_43575 [Dactylosporangium sp. NBC_01737]
MKTREDDEPRPVEFVGAGGYGVPLPFTSSSARPAAPPAPEPPKRWLWLAAAGIVLVFVAALYLTARTGATHGTAAPSASALSQNPVGAKGDLINAGLAAQAQALLGGDLDGYLASVDAELHEEFTLRFHSLRALRVARWTAQVTETPDEADDRWTVKVTIGYCLGNPACEPVHLVLPTAWTVRDGRAVVTEFQRTVLPWDLTALQGVAGRRVVVAAPASLAGQLERTVQAADRAADIADRFARWGPPPTRYVVYLAGPEEWRTWWNGQADSFDGYAAGSYGVAVQPVQDGLENLLAHEFAHVVSLGAEPGTLWWLAEGLAEYVADRDGSWTRDRLPSVRRYLRAERWDGSVTLDGIPQGASDDDRRARYGIALLAVTCLAQRFGEDQMLAFFGSVVRKGSDPEAASLNVFGTEWAPVAEGCAAQIRARAR